MKQSATVQAARRTVHAVQDRLRCARMRLHLPRRLARDELRAWPPGDRFEDGFEDGVDDRFDDRFEDGFEDLEVVSRSAPPAADHRS